MSASQNSSLPTPPSPERPPPSDIPPPQWADALLERLCRASLLESIQGDLHELYAERVKRHGRTWASIRYWWDVLWFFRPFALSPMISTAGPAMLKNYFKIAIRSLRRHKGTSAINISGLTIGIACCLVVLVFVRDELSYDRYHENEERLYRLSLHAYMLSDGEDFPSASSPILWGPALKSDFPEVEEYARLARMTREAEPWVVRFGDTEFEERDIVHADPSAFDLFSWNVRQGDAHAALTNPGSIVITRSAAERYFGREDPMGRTLVIDPRLRSRDGALTGQTFDATVAAVVDDIPRRSHFTFDFLLPSVLLNDIYGGDVTTGADLNDWFWRGRIAHTYLLLHPDASPAALEAKMDDFQERYLGDMTRSRGYYYEPFLQRIDRIYLDGDLGGQLEPVGDMARITMFSIVALFILVIACINFMNLATARSTSRAKEVGMRKVVGAYRNQLVTQFLGESVLTSFIAFVLALGVAWLVLPLFYGYLDRDFAFDLSQEAVFVLGLLGVSLAVGIFAGSYPALFLSRFRPIAVLSGSSGRLGRGSALRKGLVVFQFAISAILIVGTIVVFQQLNFMRSYQLGFDQERVMVIPPATAQSLMPQFEAFRDQLLANPEVVAVSATSGVPGQGGGGDIYVAEGDPADDGFGLGEIMADYETVTLFGLELVAGRNFSQEAGTDAVLRDEQTGRPLEVAAILNEEAVRQFGWASPEDAIGKRIIRDPNAVDWTANVVGVVRDFHFASLHEEIGPAALILNPRYNYISAKLAPGGSSSAQAGLGSGSAAAGAGLAASISIVENVVAEFVPDAAFSYSFLDEAFSEQYIEEERLAEVFGYLAFLAVFIACLGLFGLAAFVAERRTKEIGVRRILGASPGDIVVLLSRGFAGLVVVAFVLAIPLAYLAADAWLQDFAYRIDVSWTVFLLAAMPAIAIALLTVGYQAFKAAIQDPVLSLRYD